MNDEFFRAVVVLVVGAFLLWYLFEKVRRTIQFTELPSTVKTPTTFDTAY